MCVRYSGRSDHPQPNLIDRSLDSSLRSWPVEEGRCRGLSDRAN
jgi:hypothetical protein